MRRSLSRTDGEVLYLANSGELTAIFVLSYAADPDIVDELGVLVDRDIGISVYTTDSNITPRRFRNSSTSRRIWWRSCPTSSMVSVTA